MKWSQIVVKLLNEYNWFVINITSASKNGVCDVIALRNGVTLFIECKEGKDTQSALQRRFERNIKENKGIFVLAEKDKFYEFLNIIK